MSTTLKKVLVVVETVLFASAFIAQFAMAALFLGVVVYVFLTY